MMPGAIVAILHHEVKMRMDALHIKKQKQSRSLGACFLEYKEKKQILSCLSHNYFRFSVIRIQLFPIKVSTIIIPLLWIRLRIFE